MHARKLTTLGLILTTALLVSGAAVAATTQWDTTEMFPSLDAFMAARTALEGRIPQVAECRGHLGDSAQRLQQCLELMSGLEQSYDKLGVYAMMTLDKNLRNAEAQKLRAETQRVAVQIGEAVSWVEPELLTLGEARITSFLEEDPGLAPYRVFLSDVVRQAAHTLPPEQEALLAKAGLFANKFSDAYAQLVTSDMPYPTVDLPGIGEVKLNQAGYVAHRGDADREVRKAVFEGFWKTWTGYENTLGTLLNAEVQKSWFYAQSRHYPSTLAAYLDRYEIPESVYTQLIADTHRHLAVLHRMLRLRQRMLGLDTQHYYDVYASIVPQVDTKYSWEQAKSIVPRALAPLGSDYVDTLRQGLDGWVDVFPAEGKRSGAYSTGGWYEGHPWVLLNYNSSYDSLSTTAHELGHSVHSWLSNHNQPYPTAGYATMVAEVASTFNEYLLKDELLKGEKDPKMEVFLLGNFLESLRQTVFRQTMFAEFQLEMHKRAEAGETLTGESLSKLYLDLLRTYYGQDEGVMQVDDLYGIEWAYIPHFYRGFYVYQYATGMVASIALGEGVLQHQPGAVDRYLAFLSSGSSDHPVQLLQKAGVDLTTSAPFDTAMAAANRAMDRIEELLPEIEKAESSTGG